jgi:hypothetical protein
VDTVPVLGAPGGGYSDTLTNLDGTVVIVRASDGIHFTRAGGDRVAAKIMQVMGQAFDLTSWRNATTTTGGANGTRHSSSSTTTTPRPTTPTTAHH